MKQGSEGIRGCLEQGEKTAWRPVAWGQDGDRMLRSLEPSLSNNHYHKSISEHETEVKGHTRMFETQWEDGKMTGCLRGRGRLHAAQPGTFSEQ
jgi:hypothetical protein